DTRRLDYAIRPTEPPNVFHTAALRDSRIKTGARRISSLLRATGLAANGVTRRAPRTNWRIGHSENQKNRESSADRCAVAGTRRRACIDDGCRRNMTGTIFPSGKYSQHPV
ncbi:MAG: hypothetical protein ACREB8_08225, partial [Pseudolabrys sp.]